MKWLIACALIFGATLARANPACPQGPLAIAYYEFGASYHNGKGYDVDIVRELARRLNCPIQSETAYPRIRALKLLEIGQADIGTATLITEERQRYLWIYPYNHSKNLVMLRKGVNAGSLAELMQQPDLRWGMIRGYRHSPAQDKLLEDLSQQRKIVIAANEDDLYKMLCNGVITAAFGQPSSYDPWFSSHQASDQISIRDFFPEAETIAGGIAFSKKRFSQENAELWHQEILKMYRDGTLKTLMRKYLSATSVEHMLKRPLE
ncbi:ABC transporter substrate-binding protein [Chromobacterium sp. IIBBL 290-4]|uniref:substrate-binding periplasmic protein n=1 Tax=Chromobacterium sp. IIBBL 290-4 TaxID=2953890 RepID=UPI0020B7D5E1|nr:transporter substrate-binding domain-containing protein [Chromobacterium sp. IIBBL 290-4]UTH73884.1 transporter substrate-binding domain-containing protein [Chromobacterium sp. IIBBL 290-4]